MCVFVSMANGVISFSTGSKEAKRRREKKRPAFTPPFAQIRLQSILQLQTKQKQPGCPGWANMSPGANRVQVPLSADTHFNDTKHNNSLAYPFTSILILNAYSNLAGALFSSAWRH